MANGNVIRRIPEITNKNLEQFLENQSQSIQNNAKLLQLREQELKERTQQIKLNQEVALKSIEAKRHDSDNSTQVEILKQKYKQLSTKSHHFCIAFRFSSKGRLTCHSPF